MDLRFEFWVELAKDKHDGVELEEDPFNLHPLDQLLYS